MRIGRWLVSLLVMTSPPVDAHPDCRASGSARSGSRSMYRFVRRAALRNVRNVRKVFTAWALELVNYRNTDARNLLFSHNMRL